jgi:hypothetical protein
MSNLIARSKTAVHDLHENNKANIPLYKKTAHFLHAVSEYTIIHHAIHQASGLIGDIGLM